MVLECILKKYKVSQDNLKIEEIIDEINDLFQNKDNIENIYLILEIDRPLRTFYVDKEDWICISREDSKLHFTSHKHYYSTKIENIMEIIRIEPKDGN